MATINEHTSTLRLALKQLSDDSRLSDEYLYKKLNDARLLLLRRRMTGRKILSRSNYSTLCVKLEQTSFFDCGCITNDDCIVLRSTKKIPSLLAGRTGDLYSIYTLNGNQIGKTTLPELKSLQYTKTRANKASGMLLDKYLYIVNDNFKRAVVIEGVWSDPLVLSEFNICDINGNTTTELCFDPKTSDFPIDEDLNEDMYRIAIDSILQTSRIPEDKANDQEDTTQI